MINNILILFSAAVFITGGFSFYAWFKGRVSETLWEKDLALFQNRLYQDFKAQADKQFDMIHTLTRRPPREWVIEDFERLADEHPDKFHIQFILQDGTKVLLERKGFARPGEQEHKKDPYLE